MAKLYVAYGSNLNHYQMRGRCPGSEFVGTGVVENYELQFKGSLHGAHATIAPKKGHPYLWVFGEFRNGTNPVWICTKGITRRATAITTSNRFL